MQETSAFAGHSESLSRWGLWMGSLMWLSFEVQRWNPEGRPRSSCSCSFSACSSHKHWHGLFSEHLLLWGKFSFNSDSWTFLQLNGDFLSGVLDNSNFQKLHIIYLNIKYLVDVLSKLFQHWVPMIRLSPSITLRAWETASVASFMDRIVHISKQGGRRIWLSIHSKAALNKEWVFI